LVSIYLNNNNLTGQLPASWSRFCLLSTIDLYHNHLSGPLPAFGANFTTLIEITLSSNNFSGSLPETWCTRNDPHLAHLTRVRASLLYMQLTSWAG
jgi:hypothetical protein